MEILKAAGNKGVKIMTKICNHVMRGAMPKEWELRRVTQWSVALTEK